MAVDKELLSKKWIGFLLGAGAWIVLISVGIVLSFYTARNKQPSSIPTPLVTPSAISKSGADLFLSGELRAIFTVLGMDPNTRSMELEFTTSADLLERTIKPTIDCSLEESFITYTFGPPSTDKTKQAEKPLYEYQELLSSEKPVMLWAYCANRECNSLVKKCELKIQK